MLLTEYYERIIGREYDKGKISNHVLMDEQLMYKFLDVYGQYILLRVITDKIKSKAELYNKCPGLSELIPAKEQNEFLYSLLNKEYIPGIPSEFLFYVKKCVAKYSTINVFYKVFSTSILKRIFKEGYFGEGITFKDAVSAILNYNYVPISDDNLLVKGVKGWEFYDKGTDRIYLLSDRLYEAFPKSNEEVAQVQVTDTGRFIFKDIDLMQSVGLLGISNSIYNYRYVR